MRRREFVAFAAGLAVLRPATAPAQKGVPVIGLLASTSPGPAGPSLAAFNRGLNQAGYDLSKNLRVEARWAENHFERLPALAADLVARKVDMIVTFGGPAAAAAAKKATATIPILFNAVGDPIAAGLVASLAHPGGNVTGFSVLVAELNPKRFELLSELVPDAGAIALLINPSTASSARVVHDVQQAAQSKGLQLLVWRAASLPEIDAAFASLAQRRAGALLVGSDPSFNNWREHLVALASRDAIPAIYEFRESVEIGGLISYGPNLKDVNRQAGVYAGRILNGEKPADLPVAQPTKFELVINLKTAKELGLTVPPALLARADEVIE